MEFPSGPMISDNTVMSEGNYISSASSIKNSDVQFSSFKVFDDVFVNTSYTSNSVYANTGTYQGVIATTL